MGDIYFVKIGGSVITDVKVKSSARVEEIDRILTEIWEAKAASGAKIVIGHGSGSFAHYPATQYNVNRGISGMDSMLGSAITEDAARELNTIIIRRALRLGLPVFSFSPHGIGISSNGTFKITYTDHIASALEKGFIPVVYGDVIMDSERGFSIASTEDVFIALADKLKPSRVIVGTDVDGAFDSDPKSNNDAKLISLVDSGNLEGVVSNAGSSKERKYDVTGGMKGKIMLLHKLSKETGASCHIVNASVKGRIRSAIVGEETVGTTVKA